MNFNAKCLLFFLFPFCVFAQTADTTKSKWKLKLNGCKLALGYFYQGENFGEVGLKIDYIQQNPKRTKQNISFIPGIQYTKHSKASYINPFATLRYYRVLKDDIGRNDFNIGAVICVSYNYRKILGEMSNTITPEIGINLSGIITLSYGYNIFLDNKYEWVTHSRFSIRLMLQ